MADEVIPRVARGWIDDRAFAVLGIPRTDGSPHLSVVWCMTDGDEVLVSTLRERLKYRLLERDPRATLLVYPRENPNSYVSVEGTVAFHEEGAADLIQALAMRYKGRPYPEEPDAERVTVRLKPERVFVRERPAAGR
ncbi:PPOX class F420-dependent oxidoreductase [Streptomyces sp. NPDC088915]|uniref:PPOX class F420-dependent oxidoreductase n=1 Tax=Streptomyces sp. NPDC088915 TaxID=3365912 RepID=UPI0013946F11|nr:TIGR03618 family F420-dependent PPOX class oxidoreductase [Streptomyces sp. SID2131]